MNRETVQGILDAVSAQMAANRDYLIELDQVNGDGDLGISMDDGYRTAAACCRETDEADLGKLLLACGKAFNAAAPSSLGTITAFGFVGSAKALKGKTEATFAEGAEALLAGVENIMAKAGSRVGEKTIVDAILPGARALVDFPDDPAKAVTEAERAAAEGSEATRQMRAVHGRAAYSAERSVGVLDGGSVVGRLIFRGIAEYYRNRG